MKQVFEITNDHLKLLRRMEVGWQDAETGAPEIDPKRPYGNSDVEMDIAEILGWSVRGRDLTEDQIKKAMQLHAETETALQIILHNLPDLTGTYTKENAYTGTWTR